MRASWNRRPRSRNGPVKGSGRAAAPFEHGALDRRGECLVIGGGGRGYPGQGAGAATGGGKRRSLWSAFWLGGDFKENVAAGYLGGVYAVNGSLDGPGWLVRGQVTGVFGFDFAMPPAPNGHGDFFRGDGAIGYQVIGYGLVAQGFVGVD